MKLGNMKRYLSAVLAATLIAGLAACGGGAPQASPSSQTASPSPTPTKTSRPVPDVAGKSYPDARKALTDQGFFVTIVGKDGAKWSTLPDATALVVSTQPAAGTVTDTGDVEITVNRTEADQQAADKAAAAATKAAADKAAADKAAADKAAADKAAAGTVSQQNALRKAAQYIDYSAFSRTGLIGQLEYEQYSTEDATWAVDRVRVDWNVQAAKKAKDYLKYTSFSRSGLVDQLLYEGFTPEQAEYGVSQTGL